MHLDYSVIPGRRKGFSGTRNRAYARPEAWATGYSAVAAGAAIIVGLGLLAYMKRV